MSLGAPAPRDDSVEPITSSRRREGCSLCRRRRGVQSCWDRLADFRPYYRRPENLNRHCCLENFAETSLRSFLCGFRTLSVLSLVALWRGGDRASWTKCTRQREPTRQNCRMSEVFGMAQVFAPLNLVAEQEGEVSGQRPRVGMAIIEIARSFARDKSLRIPLQLRQGDRQHE